MVNSRSISLALNRSRNDSSLIRSPRGSGSVIASPFRNTVRDLAKPTAQSSSVISSPAGVNQTEAPGRARPAALAAHRLAGEETAAAEHGMLGAEPDQPRGEVEEVLVTLVPVGHGGVRPRRPGAPGDHG